MTGEVDQKPFYFGTPIKINMMLVIRKMYIYIYIYIYIYMCVCVCVTKV